MATVLFSEAQKSDVGGFESSPDRKLTMGVSLAEMLANARDEATRQRIETLISAREFVLRHRHNAKPFMVPDPKGIGRDRVGIYDVALSFCRLDSRGLVVNTRKAPAPQLIGELCIPQSDFELDYAEKAWISAATHISKLNRS
jgi:hypothetical protein